MKKIVTFILIYLNLTFVLGQDNCLNLGEADESDKTDIKESDSSFNLIQSWY